MTFLVLWVNPNQVVLLLDAWKEGLPGEQWGPQRWTPLYFVGKREEYIKKFIVSPEDSQNSESNDIITVKTYSCTEKKLTL